MVVPEKLPTKLLISRSLVIFGFRVLYRIFSRLEFIGWENVPKSGPYLLVFNHVSMFDPPLMVSFWPKAPEIIAASYLWDRPVFGSIMRWYGSIPNSREYFDRKVLDAALDTLKFGRILCLAPEGKRSNAPGLLPAQLGVAFIAEKANVPIVPIGITGTTPDLLDKAIRFKRPKITIRAGKSFSLPSINAKGKARKQERLRNADMVMIKIAELLPEEYRGVYADKVTN